MLLKEEKLPLYQVDFGDFFCIVEATHPLTLLTSCFNIVFEGKVCRIRAALKWDVAREILINLVCRIRAALKSVMA